MQVTLPTNAQAFIAFIEDVWNGGSTSNDDDGMTFFVHPLYDDFADAIVAARKCGMVRTGGGKLAGEPAQIYRFPGASDGVVISNDGNACCPARRFGNRGRFRHG